MSETTEQASARRERAMRRVESEPQPGSARAATATSESALSSIVLELARMGEVLEEIRDALKNGRSPL